MFSKKKTQHEIFQTFSGMFQKLNEDSKENILGFFEILLSKFLKDSRIRRGCLEDCTNNKDILRFQFDDLSRNFRGFEDSTRI